jgi:hypothetical protein
VAELAARSRAVLGVDVSEAAVDHTVRLGGRALRRSVFEPLPGEGRWGTVLLMDGNVGIGGDPARLLGRLMTLLHPRGRAFVEAHPERGRNVRMQARFIDAGGRPVGPAFPWAEVGLPALISCARAAGCTVVETWVVDGRTFAALTRS